MRIARRTVLAAILGSLLVLSSLDPVAAFDIDIDDPTIFGPGVAWDLPAEISLGDSGRWVTRLQGKLEEAGFRPGVLDGRFDQSTLGAVYAFQKTHDLEHDGVFLAEHWDLLGIHVELPTAVDAPDRVEVDLAKQVLFLVKDDHVQAVLPISSGNGEIYRGSSGSPVRARTPEGDYSFYKRVDGWRISYLGGLYRPYYFRGGYAIHGSRSVPPYPASHGCVRVELRDMDYLTTQLELGMPVFVYGQRISRNQLLPPESPPVRDFPRRLPVRFLSLPAIV